MGLNLKRDPQSADVQNRFWTRALSNSLVHLPTAYMSGAERINEVNTLTVGGKDCILHLIGDKPRFKAAIVATDLPMAIEPHPSGRDLQWV